MNRTVTRDSEPPLAWLGLLLDRFFLYQVVDSFFFFLSSPFSLLLFFLCVFFFWVPEERTIKINK